MSLNFKPLLLFLSLFVHSVALGRHDISREVERVLEGSRVPSLAAAVVLNGELVAQGVAGVRKHGDRTKVTLSDKYHIGSCTKSMTATLAGVLVDDGVLRWDTKASEVFTGLSIDESYREVTLQQFLTNTGGIGGDVEPGLWRELWKGKGSLTDQRMQLVEGVLSQPAAYKVGSQQVYSNAGFAIAGAMMEKVTGRSYEVLLKEKVFDPLSMHSAGFRAPASNGKVDQPYGHVLKLWQVKSIDPEPSGDNPSAIAPAAAVHCSVADFARYAALHTGAGKVKLLADGTLETLHTPAESTNYAMGWVVTERKWAGGKALMHTGSNTMFYAVMWVAPQKNLAVVAVCNYGEKEGFLKCDEIIGRLVKKYQ